MIALYLKSQFSEHYLLRTISRSHFSSLFFITMESKAGVYFFLNTKTNSDNWMKENAFSVLQRENLPFVVWLEK